MRARAGVCTCRRVPRTYEVVCELIASDDKVQWKHAVARGLRNRPRLLVPFSEHPLHHAHTTHALSHQCALHPRKGACAVAPKAHADTRTHGLSDTRIRAATVRMQSVDGQRDGVDMMCVAPAAVALRPAPPH